ncbi:MAG: Clp protease N-terminal domain-containing protein, partial [Planctomycetota bacterium]
MQPDRFTTLAQQALATAQSTAQSRSNGMLEPLHLLEAILQDDGGIGRSIIERAGGQANLLRDVARSRFAC